MTPQSSRRAQFVLQPYRSLPPRGFLILMTCIGVVSFIMGLVFVALGAWPVMGFFGLDVALIFGAFKLNYRSGRIVETIDLSPDAVELTRVHPSGRREQFSFNPFFVRVRLSPAPGGGRPLLRLAVREREVPFGQFLTDDERSDVADALSGALVEARGARF